jgi:hypothetical protein
VKHRLGERFKNNSSRFFSCKKSGTVVVFEMRNYDLDLSEALPIAVRLNPSIIEVLRYKKNNG